MKWKVYAYVQKGLSHADGVCEDRVLLGKTICAGGFVTATLEEEFLLGVADGVGGRNAGEYASGLTMLYLSQMEPAHETPDSCKEYLRQINSVVRATGKSAEQFAGMASTLTLFVGKKDNFVVQFGNSRLYEVANIGGDRILSLVTRDHNNYNDWMYSGDIPEEYAALSDTQLQKVSESSYLTSYIGMNENAFDVKWDAEETVSVKNAERIYLTSDGVHDHLTYEELTELLCIYDEPEEMLRRIADKAVEKGSNDDISIVMLVKEEADETDE